MGVLISAGVAWYISRKNIDDQKIIERNRLEVEQDAELNHFIYLIKLAIREKTQLTIGDDSYVSGYRTKPLIKPPLNIELTGNLDRLQKLNTDSVRQAILRKNIGEESEEVFRKLIGTVDFYYTHSVQRVERIQVLSKQRDDLSERLVDSIDDLRLSVLEKVVELKNRGEDHHTYKYYHLLNKIIQDYEEKLDLHTSPDFEFHEEYLVIPFAQSEHFDERILGFYKELYLKCYRVQNLFSRLRSNSFDLAKLVGQFNHALKKQNKVGEKIIRKYFDGSFSIENVN
jgi:hypothetical protein